ncbi:DUF3265 domain-containing protein [Vibrio parahaemolyticus]|nr:DUF3265 domain-containing protein [Vibrio parahaemolyticus]EJE8521507.1 DUF3265 domain-containing protein [Vibrio parahaemolyticus]EJL6383571.1 DUF3265 domain-containing protein [Vibrio parahaemolyticus]ELA7007300.1 DUF3265 domain-containing protein [Vibrio parahaemolyticus]MBE4035230.1 DUF3265 domain-containing protein [Vibrio parahaemolyticus]
MQHAWHFQFALSFVLKAQCGSSFSACFTP